MYANQVCSRIRRVFGKRTSPNHDENRLNGIHDTLGGTNAHRAAFKITAQLIRQINIFRWTPPAAWLIVGIKFESAGWRFGRTRCLRSALFAALQIC